MILMASRCFHETCGDNSENSEDSDAFTRLAGSNYKGCDVTPVIIMRDLYARDFGIISIIAIITLTLLFAGVLLEDSGLPRSQTFVPQLRSDRELGRRH
jgi:hypothetical protein